MATITLNGNTLSGSLGVGFYTNIGTSWLNAKQSTGSLTTELGSLKAKIDVVCTVTSADTLSQSAQKAKEREETKKSALALAYDKLDQFISNVGIIDNKVATKVEQLKNDFYSKYSYLKPDCEKGILEKIKDGAKKLWNDICDLSSAIDDFFCDVAEWCKGKWSELLNFVGKLINSEEFGTFVAIVVGIFDKLGGYNVIKALAKLGTLSAMFFEEYPFLAEFFPILKRLGDVTKKFFSVTLNADMDKNGVYHIKPDCWQQYVHYSTGYDNVFISALNRATGGRLTVDAYQSNIFWADLDGDGVKDKGEEFVIWSWKGDYTNLGAGAETGIYQVVDGKKDENGNYIKDGDRYSYIYAEVNKEYSLDMTLELYYDSNKDGDYSSYERLYKYAPDERQWWITGFDPKTQNVKAEDLKAVTTIDFSSYGEEQGRIMYNAFKENNYGYGKWENWDDNDLTVTLNWED